MHENYDANIFSGRIQDREGHNAKHVPKQSEILHRRNGSRGEAVCTIMNDSRKWRNCRTSNRKNRPKRPVMRFLLDGMLGRLTRWLRILGYDSAIFEGCFRQSSTLTGRHESRILLTSDAQLYRTAISRGIDCFLISRQNESERLAHLAYRFNLNLKLDSNDSRCPLCGSTIEPVQKEKIATRSLQQLLNSTRVSGFAPTSHALRYIGKEATGKRLKRH